MAPTVTLCSKQAPMKPAGYIQLYLQCMVHFSQHMESRHLDSMCLDSTSSSAAIWRRQVKLSALKNNTFPSAFLSFCLSLYSNGLKYFHKLYVLQISFTQYYCSLAKHELVVRYSYYQWVDVCLCCSSPGYSCSVIIHITTLVAPLLRTAAVRSFFFPLSLRSQESWWLFWSQNAHTIAKRVRFNTNTSTQECMLLFQHFTQPHAL